MPVEGHRAPGSVWPYWVLSTLETVENKSLLSGQKAPLRLNAKQALLILGTLGRSLDKVTIMTLEIRCADVALKRLGFRAMDNKSLFSGPRDQLCLCVLCVWLK